MSEDKGRTDEGQWQQPSSHHTFSNPSLREQLGANRFLPLREDTGTDISTNNQGNLSREPASQPRPPINQSNAPHQQYPNLFNNGQREGQRQDAHQFNQFNHHHGAHGMHGQQFSAPPIPYGQPIQYQGFGLTQLSNNNQGSQMGPTHPPYGNQWQPPGGYPQYMPPHQQQLRNFPSALCDTPAPKMADMSPEFIERVRDLNFRNIVQSPIRVEDLDNEERTIDGRTQYQICLYVASKRLGKFFSKQCKEPNEICKRLRHLSIERLLKLLRMKNPSELRSQCWSLERRGNNVREDFLTKSVISHSDLMDAETQLRWESNNKSRDLLQTLLKRYMLVFYPSLVNGMYYEALVGGLSDKELEQAITRRSGVPNALERMSCGVPQELLSIPNETIPRKEKPSQQQPSNSETEVVPTGKAEEEAKATGNTAEAQASDTGEQSSDSKGRTSGTSVSAAQIPPQPNNQQKDTVTNASSTVLESTAGSEASIEAQGAHKTQSLAAQSIPSDNNDHSNEVITERPAVTASVEAIQTACPSQLTGFLTREALEELDDMMIHGEINQNVRPFILLHYPTNVDDIYHTFCSIKSIFKKCQYFFEPGKFGAWAKELKFKTAAEHEQDANKLAQASSNKYGRGLNSSTRESTFTLRLRHNFKWGKTNIEANTLLYKYLASISTLCEELHHTLRLTSPRIEEILPQLHQFKQCPPNLEKYVANIEKTNDHLSFNICLVSSLAIGQLRNVENSNCKEQAKIYRHMLNENSLRIDIINQEKSPLAASFLLIDTNEFDTAHMMAQELRDRVTLESSHDIDREDIDVHWQRVPSPRAGSNIYTHGMVVTLYPDQYNKLASDFIRVAPNPGLKTAFPYTYNVRLARIPIDDNNSLDELESAIKLQNEHLTNRYLCTIGGIPREIDFDNPNQIDPECPGVGRTPIVMFLHSYKLYDQNNITRPEMITRMGKMHNGCYYVACKKGDATNMFKYLNDHMTNVLSIMFGKEYSFDEVRIYGRDIENDTRVQTAAELLHALHPTADLSIPPSNNNSILYPSHEGPKQATPSSAHPNTILTNDTEHTTTADSRTTILSPVTMDTFSVIFERQLNTQLSTHFQQLKTFISTEVKQQLESAASTSPSPINVNDLITSEVKKQLSIAVPVVNASSTENEFDRKSMPPPANRQLNRSLENEFLDQDNSMLSEATVHSALKRHEAVMDKEYEQAIHDLDLSIDKSGGNPDTSWDASTQGHDASFVSAVDGHQNEMINNAKRMAGNTAISGTAPKPDEPKKIRLLPPTKENWTGSNVQQTNTHPQQITKSKGKRKDSSPPPLLGRMAKSVGSGDSRSVQSHSEYDGSDSDSDSDIDSVEELSNNRTDPRGMKQMAYKYGYGPNGKLTKAEMFELWADEEEAEAAEGYDSDARSANCNQSPKHPVKVRRSKSLVDLTSPARKPEGKPAPLIDITLSPLRDNLARTETTVPCSPTPTPPSPPIPVAHRLRGQTTKSTTQSQKTSTKDAKPER